MLGLLVTLAVLAFGTIIQNWLDAYPGIPSANRFNSVLFSMTGVAAGAWWLFGFMLGTAAGALIRKTLPAVAVTVVVFLAVLIAFFNFRSGYAIPVAVGLDVVERTGGMPSGLIVDRVLDAQGMATIWRVQPAERYWQFQWTEAGILTTVTILLVAVTVFAVQRRI